MKVLKIHIVFNMFIWSVFSCQDAKKKEVEGNRDSANSFSEDNDDYSGIWVSDKVYEFSFNERNYGDPVSWKTPRKLILKRDKGTDYYDINWGPVATIGLIEDMLVGPVFSLLRKGDQLFLYYGEFGDLKETGHFWRKE